VPAPIISGWIIAFAALFGLVIGSFLNVVVYRVPNGISLLRESRCPSCDAPVRPWQNVPVVSWLALRGRCGSCGMRISSRYPLVELGTALAFAGVTWWTLSGGATHGDVRALPVALATVGYMYLAAISIALALIDLDTRRLPNAIVLPSYLVGATVLAGLAFVTGDWSSLLRAGIGMIGLYGFFFLLRAIRPQGMGGGDVKLAGLLGMFLGWVGWGALAVGAFAAFLFGGVFGLTLIVLRKAGRKSAIPFGPWMILGAWTGLFAGEWLASWYLSLYSAN
jgi:leader peptidase (prepilin peptidase)/N-methyltransferase